MSVTSAPQTPIAWQSVNRAANGVADAEEKLGSYQASKPSHSHLPRQVDHFALVLFLCAAP